MVDEVKDADTLTTAVPADLRLWGHLARPGGAQVLVSTAAISATIEADLAPTVGSSAAAAASSALSAANSATATAADHVSTTASASAAAASAAEAAAYLNGTAALTGTLPRVSRTALKALDTGTITTAWVTESGREGMFHFRSGNYATQVAADTCEGIYIKATAVSASSGAWVRAYDGPVMVTWFGAAGDGSTDDTAALKCASAVGGVGATIYLDDALTFIVSASLALLTRQRLTGGGTLKRRAQITTTTTAAMTSGVTTSVTVSDASSFRVGMQVSLAENGTARASLVLGTTLSDIRTITAIVGSTVTLSAAPTCNLSSGSTMFLTFPTVTHADRSVVEGVKFDGNRSNFTFARWEVTCEVWEPNGVDSCVTRNNRFDNAPGEGIIIQGAYGIIKGNRGYTFGGNGTHTSGCTSPRIEDNTFINGNLDLSVGHVSGGIAWSTYATDVLVSGNYIEAFVCGCGDVGDTNSGAIIVNNTLKNCYSHGVRISAGATRVKVSRNTIIDCAQDTSKQTGLDSYGGIYAAGLSGVDYEISDNYIDDPLYIVGSSGNARFVVRDNTVLGETLIYGLNKTSVDGGHYTSRVRLGALTDVELRGLCIEMTGSSFYCLSLYSGTFTNVRVSGLKTKGGSRSISIDAVTLAGVEIADSDLNDASGRGFSSDSTSSGLRLTNVTSRRGAAGGTDYIGFYWRSPNANVVGCKALNEGSGSGEHGFYLASTATGSIVTQCITRGSWSSDFYFGDVTGLFYGGLYYDGSINAGTGNTSGGGNINV